MRLIQHVVKPGASYCTMVAPFSGADVDLLDRALATTVRAAWRLPKSFPTRAILFPQNEGGAGLESLALEYTQVTVTTLVRSWNDPGRLGVVTRALSSRQMAQLGGVNPGKAGPTQLPHCTTPRQLGMLSLAGITIADSSRTQAVGDVAPTTLGGKRPPPVL